MTTRQDLNRLSDAGRGAVRMAQDDLLAFLASIDVDNTAVLTDALRSFLPALVREYGDIAATAAAEWYEEVRAVQLGGSFSAILGDTFPEEALISTAEWAAGAPDPTDVPSRLLGAVQRHVLYSQRSTVARNAEHDPAKPRFARVPTGAKTCAWCTLISSRGFVYHSESSAGGGGALSSDYHDSCNCQIVAEWDREQHHIDGYDPDRMYDQYLEARAATGVQSPTDAQVATAMRALYPDEFTDSHVHSARLH